MKKAAQATPNEQLKQARVLRGWSQKYVAEQIGADHYYLSRWERGTASPSPYYRQKLCTLFGKNARELGLLPDEVGEQHQAPTSQEIPAQASMAPIYDAAIPPLSSGTSELVGRSEALSQLRARLCSGKNLVLTALNGLPGVGKTTLAVAMAHDSRVLEYFGDGALWAGVGPQPNVLALLSRWGTVLSLSTEMGRLTTVEAWTLALRSAIGTRSMLLVIDDVWTIEDALALQVGGPNCSYLVTTRFPHIAIQFASEGTTMVHELNEDEGVTLLGRFVPELVINDSEPVHALVRLVGGLPLALNLMGKYLRTQAYSGQPRRLHAAIERLHRAEERLRLTEPQAVLERSPSLPAGMAISLEAIITVSEQQLDEQARLALRSLAVFPAKPNTFSEEAALAVCGVNCETLDVLNDAGLLQSSGPGRYTLHQTIADYAAIHLTDAAAYERLIDYVVGYVERHEKNHDALAQEATNIFAALQAAFERGYPKALIRMVSGFARFLETRGLYEQAELHLEQAQQAATSLQDTAGLATTLCFRGELAEKHGQYAQAEAYLREGLAQARQAGDRARISDILRLLGVVASRRGNYEQEEIYLQEGLALARQLQDNERISGYLRSLGVLAGNSGNYALAEAYFQEGLTLARQAGDLSNSSVMLSNLGHVAAALKNYEQAEVYLQEGLVLARLASHRQHESVLLATLGEMATEQENYALAANYLREGLTIAREIGHAWFICVMLIDWGELHLKQQQFAAAHISFKEALEEAPEGSRDRIADALYGLARVALAQGNSERACQQGEESLAIFEANGHNKAAEVRQWLREQLHLPVSSEDHKDASLP
ncbi:MAG TPA: tetratricopeptide repeat protein [Ktedonobacteraceae bacterium]|nr:tetratricopeptide repeat protein [Ktedonobacteraceae bacterium]